MRQVQRGATLHVTEFAFDIFLKSDLVDDLVPLDVVAAMVQLQGHQAPRWNDLMNTVFSEATTASSSTVTHQPWMTTELAAHYMRFAAGCYGWPMYVFRSPLAGYGLAKVLASSR